MLGGGANNGAWEAGVLYGLLHYSDDVTQYNYDLVTGISVGGVNAFAMSLWEPG